MSLHRALSAVPCLVLIMTAPVKGAPADLHATIARIDALLSAYWEGEGIEPAGPAADAEFLRRACLDLSGVIPTVSQVRDFLSDPSASKREDLIDHLLCSPRHATHLANTWRRILLPEGFSSNTAGSAGMQEWLRSRFAENRRFDRLVGDFLTATGSAETGPALFYQALDVKPEKLAARTARSFLGLRIECAQCHDHPFDDWTQEDFWGFAAFFARVQGQNSMSRAGVQLHDGDTGEVYMPDDKAVVMPRYLTGEQPAEAGGARRLQLSIWMASRENPFLARATANRVWAFLMGRGLVEPADDLGPYNPPSHPEVLRILETYFVNSEFNLRELFRLVANTRAYQLSSRVVSGDADAPPPHSFAKMAVKPLSAEQLFDSLARCLQSPPALSASRQSSEALNDPVRRQFLSEMQTDAEDLTEYRAGVQQTLYLANGPLMHAAMNEGLVEALQAPFLTDEDRLETLFLASLSRPPADREKSDLLRWITEQVSRGATRQEALADVLWALVNSAEFGLNH